MNHGSLFSGIGGFDLAAEWMGWNNLFNCEIDPFCTKVLKKHFPNSKHYDDIKKTDFSEWKGKVNIITGGFPCQPFSLAGRRKGKDDDRYLWTYMLRVIRQTKPTWVVGENVFGIASMVQPAKEYEMGSEPTLFGEDKYYKKEQQYVIETVCSDLEREGYSVQPILIPACAVGAPHRRDRIWFIAKSEFAGELSSKCENNKEQEGENRKFKYPFTESCGFFFKNPKCLRCNCKISEEKSCVREFGKFGTGNNVRNCKHKDEFNTNTSVEGLERRLFGKMEDKRKREQCANSSGCNYEDNGFWSKFPTQSPVCGRNDGIPQKLDSITFPMWRKESIKAYGNAIVPQVAFEIFKNIEKYNKLNNK